MTYYRLAVQVGQSTQWSWKTTAVTSLQAVLQLLRSYRMLPQDGIRVFTASSEAELREMLRCQNNSLASGSVTAAHGFAEYQTSEPNIRMDPANILVARLGRSLGKERMKRFFERLFQS